MRVRSSSLPWLQLSSLDLDPDPAVPHILVPRCRVLGAGRPSGALWSPQEREAPATEMVTVKHELPGPCGRGAAAA